MKPLPEHEDQTRMRRRVIAGLLAGGLSANLLIRQALAQQTITQGMQRVQGEVRVNGVLAEAGTAVRPGDSVTTGRRALAMFVVGQDAFLLRNNSRADLAGADLFIDVLRLVSGRLLSVFGKGGDRRIVTPAATIGIRGTGGYAEAENTRTYFCLCYGTADIATTDGAARDSYTTAHHESPRYIYGDGRGNAIVPASVSNHTDYELIMLEALVGRRPPDSVMNAPMMSNPYAY